MKTGPPPKKKKMKKAIFARYVPPNFDVADSDLRVPGAQFEIENIVFNEFCRHLQRPHPPPSFCLDRVHRVL